MLIMTYASSGVDPRNNIPVYIASLALLCLAWLKVKLVKKYKHTS